MLCTSRRIAVLAPLSITALLALPAGTAGVLDDQVVTEDGSAQQSPQQPADPAPQEKWFSGYEYLILGEWVTGVASLELIALLEDGTLVYATDRDLRDTTISTYTMRDGILELKGDVFPGGSLKGRVDLSDLWPSHFYLDRKPNGQSRASFRRASLTNPEFALASKARVRLKDGKPRHANGRLSLREALRWGLVSLTWNASPTYKGLWPGGSAKASGDPGDFAAFVSKKTAYPGRLHLSVEPGTIVSLGKPENSVVIASIQTLPHGSQKPPPINQIQLSGRDRIDRGHWRLRMIAYSIVPHGGMSRFRGAGGHSRPGFDADFANLFAHVPTDRYDPRVQEAVKIISLIQRDPSLIRLRDDYSGEALLDEGVPEAVALVKQALKIVPQKDVPGSQVIGLWTGDPANLNQPRDDPKVRGALMRLGNPWAYLTRRMIVRGDSTFTMYWTNTNKHSLVIAIDGSWKWRGGTLTCSVTEEELSGKLLAVDEQKMRPFIKQETRYQLVRGKLKQVGTPFLMLKHPW